ncbi:MAG: helix-turn-helix transcriptional regulator [Oscillospiraceae bacterium]|nr:helix-turn-helix transcriptional regulator [Oscillospiraceae bacterium]
MRQKDPQKIEMGKRLRQARESKGWTREKLAEEASLSVPFLADLELGNTGIRLDRFKMLCELLDTSADYILFGDSGEECQRIAVLLRGHDKKTLATVEKIIRDLVEALTT